KGVFSFLTGQRFPLVVTVSHVGYQTQDYTLTNDQPVTIALKSSANALDEVVVVGYGTQKRKNLIGSVVKIDPAETKTIPVGGFDAQLQGKAAGVQITSNTGVPGEKVNIRLRGATSINGDNTPLYVIDGVFVNSNSLQTVNTGGKATSPIADINPTDIQSVEVLKDAEASALYGSRGANGVIIVTTKRGNYNQAAKVNVDVASGVAWTPPLWDLTTGPEHAQLANENWINTGGDPSKIPFRPVSEGGRGTPEEQQTYDRLGQAFGNGSLSNYNVSLSGGNSGTKYYAGAGYDKQVSILKPITFDRASFKLNLDQRISDKVSVGISNSISRSFRNQGRAGDGPAGGILQSALHTPTYLSPYNEDGVPVGRAGFDNLDLLQKY
ncbi:MAG TPA: TonB-dependent receptor plug domain-containing protein, partial [Flavitalea sp.]|nr:TonB-dependent receptor plug domain-containing protein [Flavitalea sp.]